MDSSGHTQYHIHITYDNAVYAALQLTLALLHSLSACVQHIFSLRLLHPQHRTGEKRGESKWQCQNGIIVKLLSFKIDLIK